MEASTSQESHVARRTPSVGAAALNHQAGAADKSPEQKRIVSAEAAARSWSASNKLLGNGKKMTSRQKLPYGPLGGSGRKTNRSRSS